LAGATRLFCPPRNLKTMKTIIVLSSVSGVGKTSTIIPAIIDKLDATEVGTGHLFKSYMGMCFEPNIARELGYVPTDTEALKWFIFSGNYDLGLEAYERAKKSGKITGYQTCNFVEGLLRSTCPDQPSRQAKLICDILDRDLYVTDCINLEEARNLREEFYGYRMIIVGLDCLDPVERSGDNRKLLPQKYLDLVLQYELDDLDDLIDDFIEQIRELL
jgi:hypothetical protein